MLEIVATHLSNSTDGDTDIDGYIYSKLRDKGDIQKNPSRYIHVVCDTDRSYNFY